MATTEQVRQYLAHWFQLGRKVLGKTDVAWCPQPVIQGDRYSPEFEACWAAMLEQRGEDCYLESTEQTVAQLLSEAWAIETCSRCPLLVPVKVSGIPTGTCPCSELSSWPNFEVPMPRLPVDSRARLNHICERVQTAQPSAQRADLSTETETELEPLCERHPISQALVVQTALELHLAKAQGQTTQEAEALDELVGFREDAGGASEPTAGNDAVSDRDLSRIRDRITDPRLDSPE